ncbi:ABC transporter ATP-binding protein [Reinekea thalattae]|uniref:ABC transporter ATP-binding protein n=1 Tax=Reinekea thalattae TaxID=2593301 RepID=A0A5C8Z5N0_9GAMM|nr:ABC transporter ATP-binding protein [Reinekea thalattae]TXR53272.1 ABC transporter ATP-binding protein [Reinekea thalattae]
MLKAKDIQHLKHFFKYAKAYRVTAWIGILMLPLSIITNLLFPWLIIQVIDDQLAQNKIEGLWLNIGLLCLVLALNYLFESLYSYNLKRTGQLTVADMRTALFNRVIHLPRRYFDNTPSGVTLTRLTSDLEAIGESFVQSVVGLVKDSLITISLLVMMFVIDWRLASIVLCVIPPVMYLTIYVRNRLRALYRITRSVMARSTGFLQEVLLGFKTVQLYRAEQEVEEVYGAYTDEFLRAQIKVNKYDSILFAVISGITSITVALMIWYGSGQVLQQGLTLGVLIAFINMLEKLFSPIKDFTSQIATIQSSFASLDHVEELFTEPLDEADRLMILSAGVSKKLEQFDSLEFKNVSFRYTEQLPYVLKEVSFCLNKGQQIALVGATGSGKSTILRLIAQIYSGYEGSILLNGVELSSIPTNQINHIFSLMRQDAFLFEESVRFNIALGKQDMTDKEIKAAAEYVFADQFIEQLPNGYDFKLDKNGSNLSSGQAQLISFARAVAQKGQVFMLDEATSSVDSMTENLIQKAVKRLFDGKTVIAIAHRLSTIRHSDEILVFDQGRIVERGTHEQLLTLNAVYWQLLNSDTTQAEPLSIAQ